MTPRLPLLLALGALGLLAARALRARPAPPLRLPAPAGGAALSPRGLQQTGTADARTVRSAGRGAMRDPPRRWDPVDETGDESFPASDPPASY
ncbi:hypothetical protein [Wenxinia marina]|uniref:Uncharacterized protein n=1 Tax=Wenxinia marina DSM 24838 TaxID=1123501 RepID=A0A0D0QFS1_9RHOB|nr:hypothetical protein [Wenxinia marina]KIQ69878.1 hypothetical protein Wenmar_01448 [Wenxinia marina DSM 24838]GGL61941.1 hypothetical protein GCM10011392_15520 [Wenxinia marina]